MRRHDYSQKVARDCQQRGIKLLSIYGSTESSPHSMVNLGDSTSRMMNTDGYAATGVEIKIVDEDRNTLPAGHEGEEASRGPNVFMGYLDEPELTARALDNEGWYYSGDLCRMDEDGYIKITGRKRILLYVEVKISAVAKSKIFYYNTLAYTMLASLLCLMNA